MTTHSIHGDIHEEGLADGCPRCEEHGESPFTGLDDQMLSSLVQRVEDWDSNFPRSMNESNAMRAVERAMNQARKLVRVGWEVPG
ncbi:hypothetical protein LCGC14_1309830 [marine sediment metagenome]|uniref:Uncharacterized protein n=1 Tax=marine sediment metagenome TaxID=412755 RepID=A0A0F9NQ46_9ZZZZ